MRVTILGTGAMACLIGARLATVAPKGVTLVGTWAAGLDALRAGGIRLEVAAGQRTIPVTVARLGDAVPPAELILVLVKAWQTAQVAKHLPALLAPDGAVLTLQNGLGNLEKLGPQAHLGVTTLGATLVGPGHVRAGGDGPTHITGPAWIRDVLAYADLEVEPVEAAKAESLLWGKLAVNCGINALTALLRVPNGELLNRADAALMMDRAATECAMVAWAQGLVLPYADPIAQVRQVAEKTAANYSSMLQDVLRGAPTEIDAINGAVVRRAREREIVAAVNEMLWRMVRASTNQTLPSQRTLAQTIK